MNTEEWTLISRLRDLGAWAALFAMLALALYGLGVFPSPALEAEHSSGSLLLATTDKDREFLARMEARAQVAHALIDGRLTLLEAMVATRDLDRRSPSFVLQRFRNHVPGRTDEERYCDLVMHGVVGILAKQPDQNVQIMKRLGDELASHVRAGTLSFPPSSSGQ